MNAAIRSVARTALAGGTKVYGVRQGYAGLIAGQFLELGARDVGGIIQLGGTVLGSARCPEFKTEEGRLQALRSLHQHDIEGLVVIGGNGSQSGAHALSEMGFPVTGVASTIDNDLVGSEITLGVDTALNIALEATDRLKVTAASHQRAFLIEVMGRDCGYLALNVGLAAGAETIVIPEIRTEPQQVADDIQAAYKRGKSHALVVVAEGAEYNAVRLESYFREHRKQIGFELRATILGHVQRGGVPSAFDRLLASRLGAAAAAELLEGRAGALLGLLEGKVRPTSYGEVVSRKKDLDPHLWELAKTLAQ